MSDTKMDHEFVQVADNTKYCYAVVPCKPTRDSFGAVVNRQFCGHPAEAHREPEKPKQLPPIADHEPDYDAWYKQVARDGFCNCRNCWERYREAHRAVPEKAAVVHRSPRKGEGLTPCCSRAPFELSHDSRMTVDDALVTCPDVFKLAEKAAPAASPEHLLAPSAGGTTALCVTCGPLERVDEDGCCLSCGSNAMGPWANRALEALAARGPISPPSPEPSTPESAEQFVRRHASLAATYDAQSAWIAAVKLRDFVREREARADERRKIANAMRRKPPEIPYGDYISDTIIDLSREEQAKEIELLSEWADKIERGDLQESAASEPPPKAAT